MKKIQSPYHPREWALQFHASRKRWMVLVVHRRAGKTTAALNFIQRSALNKPNSKYAYIAPTYKMAKNVAWDVLKKYSQFIPGIEYSETELTVMYPNNSRITLYGADRPDRLRGMGLWGVVFDEYSQQPSNIFTEIIRPTLADHEGYAIWIGTPKGKNEFYRLYEKGKNDSEWLSLLLNVNDTGVISEEEIESARKTMSHEEYLQEWYCSFESAIKGAYYARELREAKEQGRIGVIPYDPSKRVFTVWDLGIGQALAVGFYQKSAGRIHMIDYWEGVHDEGIAHAISMVQGRGYVYGKHFAPHDIEVREISTGKSRIETARELGINFKIIPKLQVDDGIHSAKIVFPRLWVDENKCRLWLDAIAQYTREWDEKRGMFNETPYKNWTTHAGDVWRYASIVEEKMTSDEEERNYAECWPFPDADPYYK